MKEHKEVIEAFESIDPSGMLTTAILDQKAEKFVTVALAHQINVRAGARFAITEHKRLDMVLLAEAWSPKSPLKVAAEYQAKCAFLSEYRCGDEDLSLPKEVHRNPETKAPKHGREWWLGANLHWDLRHSGWAACPRAGLFFLFEIEDSTLHSKSAYRPKVRCPSLALQDAKAVVSNCVGFHGRWVETPFGEGSAGERVRIHMGVFLHGAGDGQQLS